VLKSLFPILSWLPRYKADNLKADFPAGLTVGVMLIPQGMAYALIAGLPMEYGLYASLVPQIIYAITGTSRHLSVGPVAMDSLLVAAGLTAIAAAGSDNYIALAIALALMMGMIQLLLGVLRAGFLVNFLSKPIISGFTSAAAIIIAANQIGNLSGIEILRSTQIQDIGTAIANSTSSIHTPTFVIGIATIILLAIAYKFRSRLKLPTALIAVVSGILSVKFLDLQILGVDIVGNIPSGLPTFNAPHLTSGDFTQLLPIAFTLALVAFMEAYSVAKTLEEKHEYKIDANQELRALGLANIFGSFFQSYPTTGGFSRTAVNEQAGATTPMSSLIAAGLIGLTLLFLTPLFFHLPLSVLAAIIIVAVAGLIDLKLPLHLWHTHKTEAVLLLATFLVTLTVGMVQGISTGIALSIMLLVYKQMRPHFTELGELGEVEGVYRNVNRFPKAKTRDEVLIIRFDSALHFANHRFLQKSITELLEKRNSKANTIILCAEAIGYIDASGISALEILIDDLEKKNIDFRLAAATGPVRDAIESSKLIARIGKARCFTSINSALKDLDNPGSLGESQIKIATQSATRK
jgi:SulP family sulfate permease